jgi:hypothetical protein
MKTEKQLWDEIADLRIKYPEKKFSLGTKPLPSFIDETGTLTLSSTYTIFDENNKVIDYETFLSENGYVYDNDKWIPLAEWRDKQINSIL